MNHKFERGQSLILVAVLMLAFMAFLAVVIDLGNAYFQRRIAQNAADAGALAGARVYCDDPATKYSEAWNAASDYVQSHNAIVQSLNIVADEVNETTQYAVEVGTTINVDTFFARWFGVEFIPVHGYAEAGCHGACLGEGVLPVVWMCNPKKVGLLPGEISCLDLPITKEKLDKYLNNPSANGCTPVDTKDGTRYACPELTIVMDNLDVDELQCDTYGGYLNCDFDGDGKDDYISGSNRGWADLDGDSSSSFNCKPLNSEGASELGYWILNGYECPFYTHTWVSDQEGDIVDLYLDTREMIGKVVILPVFNASCPEDPTGGAGGCVWHEGAGTHPPDDVVYTFQSDPNYYHINQFSAFYITCVRTKKGECPGAELFVAANEGLFNEASYNSIEGYFLKGYIPGLEGDCGTDISTGVFTIYLDR